MSIVAYPISIATDNDTAAIRIARIIFPYLPDATVSDDSMTLFDVGFDDVIM